MKTGYTGGWKGQEYGGGGALSARLMIDWMGRKRRKSRRVTSSPAGEGLG